MAAPFLSQLADQEVAETISAGTEPVLLVHTEALMVMPEIGIDLSNAKLQKLAEELARMRNTSSPLAVVSLCPRDSVETTWTLLDPKGTHR
jgi:protein-tyrosine-phosphatase